MLSMSAYDLKTLIKTPVARNTFYSLTGQVLPMGVALISIPFIIKNLGVEKFGLLTLCWTILSVFMYFDVGISRSFIKQMAENIQNNQFEGAGSLLSLVGVIMLSISCIAAGVLFFSGPLLTNKAFNIPPELMKEAQKAFYILALILPVISLNSLVRSLLESAHRFDKTNYLNSFVGSFNYLSPLILSFYHQSLSMMFMVILLVRLLAFLLGLLWCLQVLKPVFQGPYGNWAPHFHIIKYGFWLTLTNFIAPVLNYGDRLVIGSLLPLSALSYYVTPYEVLSRLWLLPDAIVKVMFPSWAARQNQKMSSRPFQFLFFALLLMMLSLIFLIQSFSKEGLRLWVGEAFATNSAPLIPYFLLAVLMGALTRIPYTWLQATGQIKRATVIQVLESLGYLIFLWWSVKEFQVMGAAIALLVRLFFEYALFFLFAKRVFYHVRVFLSLFGAIVAFMGYTYLMNQLTSWSIKALILLVALAILFWAGKILISQNLENAKQ
ncbi:MAG: hypothetical protein D6797_00465 [Bdellovibrio sp.]|nr:MAG: hypothetical protein D6797_00465 [Bdellovibrio sp.]